MASAVAFWAQLSPLAQFSPLGLSSRLSGSVLASWAQLSPLGLSYRLSGSALGLSYRFSGSAIASRAQFLPLGLSFRRSGSALAFRAQLSPLALSYRLSRSARAQLSPLVLSYPLSGSAMAPSGSAVASRALLSPFRSCCRLEHRFKHPLCSSASGLCDHFPSASTTASRALSSAISPSGPIASWALSSLGLNTYRALMSPLWALSPRAPLSLPGLHRLPERLSGSDITSPGSMPRAPLSLPRGLHRLPERLSDFDNAS